MRFAFNQDIALTKFIRSLPVRAKFYELVSKEIVTWGLEPKETLMKEAYWQANFRELLASKVYSDLQYTEPFDIMVERLEDCIHIVIEVECTEGNTVKLEYEVYYD